MLCPEVSAREHSILERQQGTAVLAVGLRERLVRGRERRPFCAGRILRVPRPRPDGDCLRRLPRQKQQRPRARSEVHGWEGASPRCLRAAAAAAADTAGKGHRRAGRSSRSSPRLFSRALYVSSFRSHNGNTNRNSGKKNRRLSSVRAAPRTSRASPPLPPPAPRPLLPPPPPLPLPPPPIPTSSSAPRSSRAR